MLTPQKLQNKADRVRQEFEHLCDDDISYCEELFEHFADQFTVFGVARVFFDISVYGIFHSLSDRICAMLIYSFLHDYNDQYRKKAN